MNTLISFFEIPSQDFLRATRFYEALLGLTLHTCSCQGENGEEQMAFFPDEKSNVNGAIIKAKGFLPSNQGTLISFNINNELDEKLQLIDGLGGQILMGKTKIMAEGKGHFAIIGDTEGNRIGLHSSN